MPFPLLLAGAALGGVASIGKMLFGAKQNKLANQINPNYVPYQTSPYARMQLGLAQQMFNGRMAGAADLERNIAASQAGFVNNVGRNATDSSQALALAAAAQGQSNSAYNDLAIQEAQNKYNLLGNLNQGYQGLINEGDKIYADKMRKFEIDTQQKAALRSSAWQNIFGGASDLAGGAMQAGMLGIGGGGANLAGAANAPTTNILPNYTPGQYYTQMINPNLMTRTRGSLFG